MNKPFNCLHNVVFISSKRCMFSEINEKKIQSLHLFWKIWGFLKLLFIPDTQSFVFYILSENYSIVCLEYHLFPSKAFPSLSCQAPPPLNLQTVQPPFLDNPLPLYCFFVNTPHPSPKKVNPKNIKVFHP